MKTSNFIKGLLVSGLVVALSACAASEPKATPKPTPTQTQTQAEIEAEFYKIADDSCAKAQKEDIVERFINDEPSRIIALAKENAYKDYSAIYVDNKGKAQVLYELELTVCWPGYLVAMMEEAGADNSGDYEHYVEKNADGTFTWSQSSYTEDGSKLSKTIYVVENGIFVKAIPEDVVNTRSLEYGPVSDEDMQALKDAVEEELNSLN